MASNHQAKGRAWLEALERPGSSPRHVSELLKLEEANVPIPVAHDQEILSTSPDKIFIPVTSFYPRQWISVVFVV